MIQDLGYYWNWEEVLFAPIAEATYLTPGFSLLAAEGHVYAVKSGDAHYLKLWVTDVSPVDNSVTMYAAYQSVVDEPSFTTFTFDHSAVPFWPPTWPSYETMTVDDCAHFNATDTTIEACTSISAADISLTMLGGSRPRLLLSGIDGAQVQDRGAVLAVEDVVYPPTAGYAATGVGVVVRPGHQYIVKNPEGEYFGVVVYQQINVDDLISGSDIICYGCIPTAATEIGIIVRHF